MPTWVDSAKAQGRWHAGADGMQAGDIVVVETEEKAPMITSSFMMEMADISGTLLLLRKTCSWRPVRFRIWEYIRIYKNGRV
ncbi:MAG: hypothetical protein ACLU45_01775 [Dialister invisus]|uniref:hypothetical protein n=1 Tax=Dialister invisus TaxID=218538 RepID=UPI00399C4837